MATIDARKAQLEERLAELNTRLRQIEDELESHGEEKDWEDIATEREDDEVLEGIGRTGQQEVRMIQAALQRISAGEFGICVRCGAEISQERLDLLPYTPFCRTCAT